MTTLKTSSSKTASLTTKHLDVRLRKIRSLKTSALKPLKIVAAAKIPDPKPSIKSVVPYGLVIAALVLSGTTASEAHAAPAHAKAAGPAHVVTRAARRHAVPAWEGGNDQWAWPTFNMSPPSESAIQQAAEDDFWAAQRNEDARRLQEQVQAQDVLNASVAAAAAQAALDSQMTLQTEINANNGN